MIPILACDRLCSPECPACAAYAQEMRELNGCSGFSNHCGCDECKVQENRWIRTIEGLIAVPWWKRLLHRLGVKLARI